MALLAAIALPLAGCDSSGANSDEDPSGSLTAPSNVTATAQSDGTVDLSWDGVSAAAEYNVYRSTSPINDVSGTPEITGATSTMVTDYETSGGTTYNYRVTSIDGGTESSLSSSQTVTTKTVSGGGGGGGGSSQSWTSAATTGTDNTINDVAVTSAGAYAVADGGILLKRTGDEEWKKVLQNGPSSNGNNLLGIAVTDDGEHLWLVGASGRIGEWEVTTGSLVEDHSAPNSVTNDFAAVTVTGDSEAADVQIADKSGKVLYSTDDGGSWTQVTPGSGSALRAIDTYASQKGHLVDANQSVFKTTDGGGTWNKTGIMNANVTFYGIDSDATDDVWVAAGNGVVYRWDGSTWSDNSIGQSDLKDLEVAGDDNSGYAVGGSGTVFAYDGSWTSQSTPTTENLNAVVLKTTDVPATPAIAVGAGGTILER
jgi:photosystem II stability/assembly factor-like uncharacterized protein